MRYLDTDFELYDYDGEYLNFFCTWCGWSPHKDGDTIKTESTMTHMHSHGIDVTWLRNGRPSGAGRFIKVSRAWR